MKKLLRASTEVLLLSVLVYLVARDLTGMPVRVLPPPPDPMVRELPAAPVLGTREADTGALSSPAEISLLFGRRLPPPLPPPALPEKAEVVVDLPPPEKVPVKAVWFSLIGKVVDDGGRQVFFLKDSRTRKVVRVVEGEEHDGYRALQADGLQFLLSREEEIYKVEVK